MELLSPETDKSAANSVQVWSQRDPLGRIPKCKPFDIFVDGGKTFLTGKKKQFPTGADR